MSIIIDDLNARALNPRKVAGTNGGEYHCPCPGCGGRDRFHVWPEQGESGTWWCRGCNKGGDAIEYLREYCGHDFKAAAAAVGRDVSDIPRRPVTPRKRQKPEFEPSDRRPPHEKWREKAAKLVDWAHDRLLERPEQMAYLAGRGISEKTVRRYRIGYNPGENGKNAIFRARKAWGLPSEQKNGRERALWIPRGLVIPMVVDGIVHRIRIRREKEDLTPEFNVPYYVLPGGSASTLVVGDDFRAFVVVEAELDAFACVDAAGDLCCAAAMGSSSTKPDSVAADLFKKSLCILNALDFDDAGAKSWQWWRDQFEKSKRWPVPKGKDPGDAYAAGVNLRAWILAGLPPVFRRPGSTVLDGERLKAEKEKEEPPHSDDSGIDVPQEVQTVASWFKKYPVRIIKDGRGIKYRENRAWAAKHPNRSRKVNLAVFMDPVVMAYVHNHPARVISGENFISEN